MRTYVALLGFLTLSMTAAIAEIDCQCFTPTTEQIAAPEQRIDASQLPLHSLERYVRYYYEDRAARQLFGKLAPRSDQNEPAIRVVTNKVSATSPLLEGCVLLEETSRQVRLHCVAPDSWTPSEAQLSELESALFKVFDLSSVGSKTRGIDCRPWGVECRALDLIGSDMIDWLDPSKVYLNNLPSKPLSSYQRYYAGITRNGEPIIVGVLLSGSFDTSRSPERRIVSESKLPGIYDDGCNMVRVIYHPQTKTVTAGCDGS
jgi:hypothetical protein